MVVLHPTPASLLVARPVEVESSLACDPAPTLNHVMVGRTVLETTKRHASAIHSLAQVSLFYEAHDELNLIINKNALSSVESRVLGVKQPGLLYYFFVWNTKRVLYVIMYILKK